MNNKAATSSSLRKFLRKPAEEDATTVHPSIQAEVKMAMMIVHHNTYFNLSDHLTRLVNSKFQGSAAAENFACGRTKTSAIINCLGNEFKVELVEDMKKFPLIFIIDGSNDTGIAKMDPITVRIYDVIFNRVMTNFFEMNLIEGSSSGTAATIFQRSNLDLRSSLSSTMTIKMNKPEDLLPCHRFKPSKNLLSKCKAACREYNRAHTSVAPH